MFLAWPCSISIMWKSRNLETCKLGDRKTQQRVKNIVESVAVRKKMIQAERVTDWWWTHFLQRHSKVSQERKLEKGGKNKEKRRKKAETDECQEETYEVREKARQFHLHPVLSTQVLSLRLLKINVHFVTLYNTDGGVCMWIMGPWRLLEDLLGMIKIKKAFCLNNYV